VIPARFHGLAVVELAEAVRWYESKRQGLGAEFLDEVARVIDFLQHSPELGTSTPAHRSTRRCRVSRFPFSIVYVARPDEIVVVAVAHMKRRPGYWQDRSSSGE